MGLRSRRCRGQLRRARRGLASFSFCSGKPAAIGKTQPVPSTPVPSTPVLWRGVPAGPQGCCPQGWAGVTYLPRVLLSWRRARRKIKGGFSLLIFKAFPKWIGIVRLFLMGLSVCFGFSFVVSSSERRSHEVTPCQVGHCQGRCPSASVPGVTWGGRLLCTRQLSSGGCWSVCLVWHKCLQLSYLLTPVRLSTWVSV